MKRVAIALLLIYGFAGTMQSAQKEDVIVPEIQDGDARTKQLIAQLESGDAQAAVALSDISDGLFEGGKKEEAVKLLQILAKQTVHPKARGTALLRLGLLYQIGQYFAQDFAAAADLYNQIADDPQMSREIKIRALYNLGLLYFNGSANFARNYAKALEQFEQVAAQTAQDPGPSAAYYVGIIYFNGGFGVAKNNEEAKKYFEAIAHDAPHTWIAIDAKYKLGQVYMRYNKIDQAIQLFTEVADSAVDPLEALLARQALAQIFINQKQWDQAVTHLEKLYNQVIDRKLVIWAAKQLAFMYADNEYIQKNLQIAGAFARFIIDSTDSNYADKKIMIGFLRRIGLEMRERDVRVRKPGIVTKENPK